MTTQDRTSIHRAIPRFGRKTTIGVGLETILATSAYAALTTRAGVHVVFALLAPDQTIYVADPDAPPGRALG